MSAIITIILDILVRVALGAVYAVPVMWLWNVLFTGSTSIVGTPLPDLDFWQAWCLLLLCEVLFKNDSSFATK